MEAAEPHPVTAVSFTWQFGNQNSQLNPEVTSEMKAIATIPILVAISVALLVGAALRAISAGMLPSAFGPIQFCGDKDSSYISSDIHQVISKEKCHVSPNGVVFISRYDGYVHRTVLMLASQVRLEDD